MNRPVRRINYSHEIRNAGKIRQLSDDLTNESNDLNNVINEVVYIWKGEAAKQFISKGGILEDDMKSTATKLDDLASNIESVAAEIKREDDRRLERYYDWLEEQED